MLQQVPPEKSEPVGCVEVAGGALSWELVHAVMIGHVHAREPSKLVVWFLLHLEAQEPRPLRAGDALQLQVPARSPPLTSMDWVTPTCMAESS